MLSIRRRVARQSVAGFSICIVFLGSTLTLGASGRRVRLIPSYALGQTLHYRIELRTTSAGKTTAPIANPEGGSNFSQVINLLVRLEVLPPTPSPQSSAVSSPAPRPLPGGSMESSPVRFRVTYERAHAKSEGDAAAIEDPSPDERYDRLEGQSIEFTLAPGGQLTDFRGLENIFPNASDATSVLSWARGLAVTAGLPAKGIAIGERWGDETPLMNSPLAGLIWRTTSTYLRNESCASPRVTPRLPDSAGAGASQCAVILTRFKLFRRGSDHSDVTPPGYLRNGLRTSGTWTGSGESLDSVSLSTGVLVSSTQTSVQNMDYEITSASTGSSIRQTGQIRTQSEVALVSASQPAR